jgi:class 3 adenylate cyclase/tetratricopeptide (TPR) repeat protein
MECSSCGAGNRDGARFCTQCGSALDIRCRRCDTQNAPGDRFCAQCGAPLSVLSNSLRSASTAADGAEGERRHLTVLFSDLVNSTAIAAQLDPEEWRELAAEYQRVAAGALQRYGGYVAKFLGDGLVAYFGYPVAHENDAERAVQAGLAVLDGLAALNGRGQASRPRLSVRVGIHTGAVVIGKDGSGETDVFGDTPNIAARVQGAAEPDSVYITAAVHRLVSGLFVVEDRGLSSLKGVAGPTQLFRVIQPSGLRGRLHAEVVSGALTPFIGRDDELRVLMESWGHARDGAGRVVQITGEAGIGKSRLVRHFRRQLSGLPHNWLEAAAAPLFQNTPFHPIADLFQHGLQWRGDESSDERMAALERALELAGLKLADSVPLLAPLFGIPIPQRYPPLLITPDQQRKRLLATLCAWVSGLARIQPLVLAFEDLHWADASTLELMQLLVERAQSIPLLLLLTARPEFHPAWSPETHSHIVLRRLNPNSVREMVARVATRALLANETVEAIVARTGGVPLFVEEITRALLENGEAKPAARQIPATLADSLMARLDRLGAAKQIAQIGAVIGHEFPYRLIAEVYQGASAELDSSLQRLVEAELLQIEGGPGEALYTFKHALIQDAAYEALLKSRRRELHRRIAQVIVEKLPEIARLQPEFVARHWTDAGEVKLAIEAWRAAGAAALTRRAFKEAEQAYQQARALISEMPESAERDRQELRVQGALAAVLGVTKGYSASEAVEAAARATVLAEKRGSLRESVAHLASSWTAALSSGDYRGASALADRVMELARHEGSAASFALAHMEHLMTRYYRGDLAGSEEHFVQGSRYFNAPDFLRLAGSRGSAFGLAGLNAWAMGRVEIARQRVREGIPAPHEENPFDFVYSQYVAALLRMLLGYAREAEQIAARVLAVADEHSFQHFAAISRIVLGRARAELGHPGEGLTLIRRGLAMMAETSTRVGITLFLNYLAETQMLYGAIDEAFVTVGEALEANPEELIYRPRNLTFRGELLARRGAYDEAIAAIREALAAAHRMGASMPELRAATGLARLLVKHGDVTGARELLHGRLAAVNDGLGARDVLEARTLLHQLEAA